MTDLRKAAEMALDALLNYPMTEGKAIHALRQALADQKLADAFAEDFPNTWGKKKHTAQPSKPWVSLTDEDFDNIYKRYDTYDSFARAIEAKLKEKNT